LENGKRECFYELMDLKEVIDDDDRIGELRNARGQR
jgi:hypothetical protein